ncbi:peptidase [Croceicoccus mobilis]|uniref:Peptidase n=2 Tax=Croceicoccus mobilis TaxID=1703339 RepID=A0A916YX39_9SPHN|nr:peptidase [Croceicoccus mobilis]
MFASLSPAHAEEPLLKTAVDVAKGTVSFVLPEPDADGSAGCYIYASTLRSGLGSARIRLDRGMIGEEQLLCFQRYGGKVAVRFENPKFRASGDAGTETGAQESFAFSIPAMLPILNTGKDGSLTVDMAPFLASDVIGIGDALKRGGGSFRFAPGQSAVDAGSLKAFPDNIEIDAVQTFTSDNPGSEVKLIAPDAKSTSYVVHHSFIRLPEPGFEPRLADPRAPVGGPVVYDYGSALGMPLAIQLAAKFRLEKADPTAERSTVKKPIVFYIDPAAPEPVRTALVEGVNYWQESFEKAGFIDAFRAEVLPEGADPMDVRYSMVNWSNRLTRGWSYGGGIRDPRTGEIIKGNVVIGALRVWQDIAIFEGLVGTAQNGTGGPNDPVRAALDRIRQLGAHEVGHAIGFMHNFAGSTQDRTTVMDYPPPRIKLTDGKIDLSDAYAKSGGAWDDFSVDWLYGQPAPGVNPDAAAAEKALAIKEAGVAFATDIDGRDIALPSALASMWDDGPEPIAALDHMVKVRDIALSNFGYQTLLPGEPKANLRRKFVPIWLLHRYDVEAAGKLIGGMDYEYAVVGDNHPDPKPVAGATQTAAMNALIDLLSYETLTVPDRLVPLLSAPVTRLPDQQFNIEVMPNAGAAAFDPLVAADIGAQLPLESLLAPERLTRMLDQHRRDPSIPGPAELVAALDAKVVSVRPNAIARRIAYRTVLTIAEAAMDKNTAPGAAAILDDYLTRLGKRLTSPARGDGAPWASFMATALGDRERLIALVGEKEAVPDVPPGMPIGGDTGWFVD